ncbi:hypothetical protein AAZX31_17G089000 [Glycine max]|uniref:RING-type E3 ubiquitin transferase n=2 Tax=Glycine subgen. Soja TaxID=1462606 RepID=I1MTJ3_SOYBN|nr:RING-H2 finger protein ATL47 [Glycine max]XP_028209710.1 RING-H2 finger protein ATL47-like [Glycine soja]KAG4929944.1 hypothetical protein JHK86_046905 [Glycine max]KAG4942827.1 hypothetical protein JHK85_047473 [Glycine max]KAG5097159.1 hypothetical protein JHK82_047013 [Glycine max]KAG5101946.1 hypothetical protein JHK84_046915 [Glycine max]KAH1117593.1 hypothetical protein GYH30_046731 [Glycine max]|eukprot:XP_003550745.1 RING-H2 finger protein ATL47 [Glycine max]
MRSINGNLKYSSYYPQSPNDVNMSSSNNKEATTASSLSRISPLILLVIIVLAVIFFVYGLVHLILWFFMKRPLSPSSLYNSNRFHEYSTRSRVLLQRQLQQLFRLHDSGLDQAVIDALPVFCYQDLLGSKEPFDCAVCLCEFSEDDKLRLLPMCTHAFHMNCLDTWLLSNSTCPLCRASLSEYMENQNPMFNVGNSSSLVLPNRFRVEEENNGCSDSQRVFSVRLGKFRNGEVGGDGGCSLSERRCYSMGSYRYVVRDLNLQVVLSHSQSQDDDDDVLENGNVEGKRIGDSTKGESFSVSKIWLWSKKTRFHGSNAPFP